MDENDALFFNGSIAHQTRSPSSPGAGGLAWKWTRPPGRSLIGSSKRAMVMITAIIIPVDLAQPIRRQQIDRRDLDAYRQIVGGNLEVLTLDRPPATMYLNEEGKLARLRVNQRATTLMWVHNSTFRGWDVVVGSALLVGPPDRHGNDRSVPEDLADLLLDTERYRIQVQTESDVRWSSVDQVFTNWFDAYRYAVQLTESWNVITEVRVMPVLDSQLRETWYQLGIANPWIKAATDPSFTRGSFVGCYSIKELAEQVGHGNWSIGTAFYYRDLCFINQVDGGDEWLTIRHGIAFESMTLEPSIEDGSFAGLIRRLLRATKEQCQQLTY